MNENDFLTVMGIAIVAGEVAVRITKAAFSYKSSQRSAARKASLEQAKTATLVVPVIENPQQAARKRAA